MAAAASTTQTVTGESTNTETGVISVPPHALDWPIAAANSTTQHNSDCQTERRSHSTVVSSKDRTEEKRKTVCFVMFGSNTQPDRTSQSQYGGA
ncbi:hypothetical protein J6590_042151 [Homalodisca vitripennis]|nr:hypothetical protein J6590_042151 [Homalodisca vitripennis]